MDLETKGHLLEEEEEEVGGGREGP